MTDIDDVRVWKHGHACPVCRYVLPPLKETLVAFFETGMVTCLRCNARSDPWANLLEDVSVGFAPWDLRVLGANETVIRYKLAPGELKVIDCATAGVPTDAKIIAISHSSNGGGCYPVDHGASSAVRYEAHKRIGVAGVALSLGDQTISSIYTSVYWVPSSEEADAWRLLSDALSSVLRGDYVGAIAPAHTAVEIAVMRVISEVLTRAASGSDVRKFIQTELTAASAFNVLLPALCAYRNIPGLSRDIRGRITRLRSLRNQVAHEGVTREVLNEREVRELLVAAIFAFEYVLYIRPKLTAA